uniref:Putative CBM13: distantly related to b-1, 4-xylan binding n=1 Tax=Magnetococcus massalia (strain MO-1) TaxID=451514 RepID=A0A1S7LJC1_MAGMO|nr:putative CBM13 : distantly related to b-1, 4-xylan binding [Candidatus Magnetococcus massalia]
MKKLIIPTLTLGSFILGMGLTLLPSGSPSLIASSWAENSLGNTFQHKQLQNGGGWCADENSGKLTKGGQIVTWTCNGRGKPQQRQLWTHNSTGQIASIDRQCMDVESGQLKAKPGTKVVLWTCNNSAKGAAKDRQLWLIKSSGQVVHRGSGLCLDVARNGAKGGELYLSRCNKKKSQIWSTFLNGLKGKAYCGIKLPHYLAGYWPHYVVRCEGVYGPEESLFSKHLGSDGSWGFPLIHKGKLLQKIIIWSESNATSKLTKISSRHGRLTEASDLKRDQTLVIHYNPLKKGRGLLGIPERFDLMKSGFDKTGYSNQTSSTRRCTPRTGKCVHYPTHYYYSEVVSRKGNDWGW